MTDTDVPDSVTYREIQEILRTFRDSSWRSMTLDLHGMRITVGKDGPPTGSAPAPAAGTAPGSAVPAAAPAPPVAVAPPPPSAPAPAAGTAPRAPGTPVDTTGCIAVRSPAVGAFWVAPSPGQPPFVEIGATVAVDEQLAIVEVMKLMNPVVSPVAGELVAVEAANADLVEYEQVLFWIRPSDAG